jgi:hypothetical protein
VILYILGYLILIKKCNEINLNLIDTVKPTVTYYPPIANDQNHLKNFGIRQISKKFNFWR